MESSIPVSNAPTTSNEQLHPSNDPEREGEIRYCRRPPLSSNSNQRSLRSPRFQSEPNRQSHQSEHNGQQNGQTYERKKKTKNGGHVIIPMDDSRVIPYNPYLLLKFGCHINIEYVFGQKACKYIFKYLLKGYFLTSVHLFHMYII